MLFRLVAAFALALAASAPALALATPPDVIDIRDEPFGLSATHLFVLRTTDDNLGLYESSRIETFLVAIDLDSGEEEYWPVYRALRTVDYDEDGNDLGVVVRQDKPTESGQKLARPFGVLAQNGGVPWSAVQSYWRTDRNQQALAGPDAFVIAYSDRPPLRVARRDLQARMDKSGAAVAKRISNYPRMSMLQTKDLFVERRISNATCKSENVWRPFYPFGKREIIAVRFICSDEDETGSSSLIQVYASASDAP